MVMSYACRRIYHISTYRRISCDTGTRKCSLLIPSSEKMQQKLFKGRWIGGIFITACPIM